MENGGSDAEGGWAVIIKSLPSFGYYGNALSGSVSLWLGKPVRINSWYYKERKKGVFWTALAGPLANFIMAFAGMFSMGLIYKFAAGRAGSVLVYLYNLLNYFAVLNIGLGVFNLIPIPPLDGSKVYGILVHDDENYMEKHVNRYGYFVLAILAVTGILSIPMSLAQNAVIRFMYGIVRSILRF